MAITRVNKLGTTNNTGSGLSSLTLTVGATTTAHNRIIVAVYWGGSFDRTVTVADSAGNGYVQDVHGNLSSFGSIFSSRADAPLTGGSSTITVAWSGGTVTDALVFAYEYSGLAQFSPVDVTAFTSGQSSAPTASVTTTKANSLIFGMVGWASGSNNLTLPSQTELDNVHGGTHSLETQEEIVSATGTYTVSATFPGGQTPFWQDLIVAYADTTNGSAHQPSNSTAPAITGSGVLGMQLTCSQGVWANVPTAYAYQWKRDGSNVSTGAHYLVTASDVGHVLTCAVTASNKYGSAATTSSNSVTVAVNKVQSGMGI